MCLCLRHLPIGLIRSLMANSEAEEDRWDFWAGGEEEEEESRYVDFTRD